MFGLSTLVTRIITGALIVIVILFALQVRSCQMAKQRAAESRLERAQSGATVESAKDAIATQGNVAAAQAEGEELTRTNEKEIRDAKGADAAVDPAVRDAGLRSLCRRPAYRSSERCVRFLASR